MNEPKFKVGDLVERCESHRFPGVVVSVFTMLDGEWRYVIEASHTAFRGALEIVEGHVIQRRGVQPVVYGRMAA